MAITQITIARKEMVEQTTRIRFGSNDLNRYGHDLPQAPGNRNGRVRRRRNLAPPWARTMSGLGQLDDPAAMKLQKQCARGHLACRQAGVFRTFQRVAPIPDATKLLTQAMAMPLRMLGNQSAYPCDVRGRQRAALNDFDLRHGSKAYRNRRQESSLKRWTKKSKKLVDFSGGRVDSALSSGFGSGQSTQGPLAAGDLVSYDMP